jgi:hypothetical protein
MTEAMPILPAIALVGRSETGFLGATAHYVGVDGRNPVSYLKRDRLKPGFFSETTLLPKIAKKILKTKRQKTY